MSPTSRLDSVTTLAIGAGCSQTSRAPTDNRDLRHPRPAVDRACSLEYRLDAELPSDSMSEVTETVAVNGIPLRALRRHASPGGISRIILVSVPAHGNLWAR